MKERQPPHLLVQIAALTVGRLFLNAGLRVAYPYLPELARGLGRSQADIARLISIRNFSGLLSPLFVPLSARFGRRITISLSLVLFSAGGFLLLLAPNYWALGITLSAIAVAKVIYDPAMQAYLGDTVPYGFRGRALAVTEFSWAGGFLVGVPVTGFILQRQGWRAPFLWMALFGLGAILLLWRTLPPTDSQSAAAAPRVGFRHLLRSQPVIWAAALYVMLAMAANELLLVVYGGWMEATFELNLTNLGLATGVIGGAEISGELLTGLAVDRFGKRPVILITGTLTALMYLLTPLSSGALWQALLALFILFLFFEMTIVGGVPLLTEIVPHGRVSVMSVVLAASSLGRALGALLGPWIAGEGRFLRLGAAAALIMLLAVLVLARWIREGQSELSVGRE